MHKTKHPQWHIESKFCRMLLSKGYRLEYAEVGRIFPSQCLLPSVPVWWPLLVAAVIGTTACLVKHDCCKQFANRLILLMAQSRSMNYCSWPTAGSSVRIPAPTSTSHNAGGSTYPEPTAFFFRHDTPERRSSIYAWPESTTNHRIIKFII